MRKYLYIGIGGTAGAILRFLIKQINIAHYQENVPLNTLFINIVGCFLLALVLTVAFEILEFSSDIRLGIATGFLGAFTTFSTLCKETIGLIYSGHYFSAISYITVSTMLGVAASYFGVVLAREVVKKVLREKSKQLSSEQPIEESKVE